MLKIILYTPCVKSSYEPIGNAYDEKNFVVGNDSLIIELILKQFNNVIIHYLPFKEEDEYIVGSIRDNFKNCSNFKFSFFDIKNQEIFIKSSLLITDISKVGIWYYFSFMKPVVYYIPFMNDKLIGHVNFLTQNAFLNFVYNIDDLYEKISKCNFDTSFLTGTIL